VAKMGMKFNKVEFLNMLSNMLDTDSLIFAFKEKGALLLCKFYYVEHGDVRVARYQASHDF